MRLRVTPQAWEDLREIEEYIGRDNPKACCYDLTMVLTYLIAFVLRETRKRHKLGILLSVKLEVGWE